MLHQAHTDFPRLFVRIIITRSRFWPRVRQERFSLLKEKHSQRWHGDKILKSPRQIPIKMMLDWDEFFESLEFLNILLYLQKRIVDIRETWLRQSLETFFHYVSRGQIFQQKIHYTYSKLPLLLPPFLRLTFRRKSKAIMDFQTLRASLCMRIELFCNRWRGLKVELKFKGGST